MKQKSVVITGATGVIGMALVEKCIEEGIDTYVLVNPSSSRIGQLEAINARGLIFGDEESSWDDYDSCSCSGSGSILGRGSLCIVKCGLDDLASAGKDTLGVDFGQVDCFYHLAWGGTYGDARNDVALQEKNVEYTLDAVRLAHRLGCSCFVGVGSQAEYGRVGISESASDFYDSNSENARKTRDSEAYKHMACKGLVNQIKLSADTPTNPETEYGKAKLSAGIRSRELCSELGMRHIWTRVLSIYGPFDGPNTLISSTIYKILKGQKPSLTAGEQVWDYLYSKDAAKALVLLGSSGVDGQVYPIGSGKTRLLKDYIRILRDNINPEVELGFGDIPYFDKQVMYLCADISNLTRDTGFVPNYDFEEGIRETISWAKTTQVS